LHGFPDLLVVPGEVMADGAIIGSQGRGGQGDVNFLIAARHANFSEGKLESLLYVVATEVIDAQEQETTEREGQEGQGGKPSTARH
jgi:hypothetical protein